MLTEHAVDGCTGCTMALCQLAETLAQLALPQDGVSIECKRLVSDVPAFELRPLRASPRSLDDQVALEFSDGPDDDDDGSPQRPASVDLFVEADELDVQPVQLIEHLEEVLHRPGDPIGSPDQDDVELTAAAISHHGIESRPASLRSADPIRILFDDPIATLLGHLAEVIELGLGVSCSRCSNIWSMIFSLEPSQGCANGIGSTPRKTAGEPNHQGRIF